MDSDAHPLPHSQPHWVPHPGAIKRPPKSRWCCSYCWFCWWGINHTKLFHILNSLFTLPNSRHLHGNTLIAVLAADCHCHCHRRLPVYFAALQFYSISFVYDSATLGHPTYIYVDILQLLLLISNMAFNWISRANHKVTACPVRNFMAAVDGYLYHSVRLL